MIIIPYKKLVIESPVKVSAGEFSHQLLDHSEKNSAGYYWFRRPGKSFAGEANLKEFSVIKTVPYWNLSPLKITGNYILDDPLVIEVKMVNPFAIPIFVILILIINALFFNYGNDFPLFLIGGILIVFYLLINIPFQSEAMKAKNILLEISKGKVVKK